MKLNSLKVGRFMKEKEKKQRKPGGKVSAVGGVGVSEPRKVRKERIK